MMAGILPCCSCLNVPLKDKLMCMNCLLQGLVKNVVWDIGYKRPCPIINLLMPQIAKMREVSTLIPILVPECCDNHIVHESIIKIKIKCINQKGLKSFSVKLYKFKKL